MYVRHIPEDLQRDICIMLVLSVGAHVRGVITQENKITRRKEYLHPKTNTVKARNNFDVMGHGDCPSELLKDVLMRNSP